MRLKILNLNKFYRGKCFFFYLIECWKLKAAIMIMCQEVEGKFIVAHC